MTIKRIEYLYEKIKDKEPEDLPEQFYLMVNGYEMFDKGKEIEAFVNKFKKAKRNVKFQAKTINTRGLHLWKIEPK